MISVDYVPRHYLGVQQDARLASEPLISARACSFGSRAVSRLGSGGIARPVLAVHGDSEYHPLLTDRSSGRCGSLGCRRAAVIAAARVGSRTRWTWGSQHLMKQV